MKKIIFFLILPFITGCPTKSEPHLLKEKEINLSDSEMEQAFETGRSLLIATILNSRTEKDEGALYLINPLEAIIPGDLTEAELQTNFEIAGNLYRKYLEIGSTYILFITKGPYNTYGWAHRDFAYKFDPSQEDISKFRAHAQAVYAKGDIKKFRETPISKVAIPSRVPSNLQELCRKFKDTPENRFLIAQEIGESEICSKRDPNILSMSSSQLKFLKPEIILSRDEVVALLGQPDFKSGYNYAWHCRKNPPEEKSGVISAGFDNQFKTTSVLFSELFKTRFPVN